MGGIVSTIISIGLKVAKVSPGWGYAFTALSFAYSAYSASKQKSAAKKKAAAAAAAQTAAFNASLQDRTVTRVSNEAPYTYVLGRAKVGSTIVQMLTSGDKDQYKHLVCIHAAHECDGYEEIYINGTALGTLDGSGNVTGGKYYSAGATTNQTETHTGSSFSLGAVPNAGSLSIIATKTVTRPIYGQPTTTWGPVSGFSGSAIGGPVTTKVSVPFTLVGADVTLDQDYNQVDVTYTTTSYTSQVNVRVHLGTDTDPVDSVLNGLFPTLWPTTAVLRDFTYSVVRLDLNQAEFQGGLPDVQILLRGMKLYDPRDASTVWSQNNALAAYWYLTSELCNVSVADLPVAEYITAANVCDEVESFGAKYTFNGTITSDQDQQQVLTDIARSMAGGIVPTTWSIWAGKYIAPVLALDQSDIIGNVGITPGISDADVYNGISGQYTGSETSYIATDFTPYQNATYLTADGRDKIDGLSFPFTNELQRVHNLCRIFTEDQRNAYTLQADLSYKAWPLKVGQRCTFNSTLFGFPTDKVFRVTDRRFSPTSPITLTLKEDVSTIWDLADAVTVDSTPNTNLTDGFVADPVVFAAPESGEDQLIVSGDGTLVSRILVSWDALTSSSRVIDLEWQPVGGTTWQHTSVTGDKTSAYCSPVQDGEFYVIRARVRDVYFQSSSDWTYETHQVIGKTMPPDDITDLSISGAVLNWTRAGNIDLAGSVFRFHYGINFDWGSAANLHSGIITQAPFDLITRPSGIVTIMGKNVDTSGNESAHVASVVMNLGDAPVVNVVETIDFKALSFPGTLTNCTINSTNLVADVLDSAYGTDDQSFYGLDNDPAYDASAYAQMAYQSEEVAVSTALAGSLMTLAITYLGIDLHIYYRLSGPGSVYGSDSNSAYGLDANPFYDGPGSWIPWPGQIVSANDVYEFLLVIGAGATQGVVSALSIIIDAPDIVETFNDVTVSAAGTVIPYTKAFTVISAISGLTLQANGSGAETVEVDKTSNLAPSLKAYNSSHTAVSGAKVDGTLQGY